MPMPVYEYVGNPHVHTHYSDGAGSHIQVAQAALAAGLDYVVFTDHNLRLSGIEGYYGEDDQANVLILSGEEVHDRTRDPQCNHVLAIGAGRELAAEAHDLANLLAQTARAGGLSFIAHPDDSAVPRLKLIAIPWTDRFVQGFTGLEIWNFMSQFKAQLLHWRTAIRGIFRPEEAMLGPDPVTLQLWDQLLATGHQVVGIGGADAHAQQVVFGPLYHVIFPYDFLFSCVNTHILTKAPLTGEADHDSMLLLGALREGRAFVGYGIPGDPRGFRFSAQGQGASVIMGETIRLGHGVTLQTLAPGRAHILIIRHGEVVAEERNTENLTLVVRQPGAYRVEVRKDFHGAERTWILSNPIYVEGDPTKLISRT